MVIGHADLAAVIHAAHTGRAGPAFAVHGALMLTDPADSVGELDGLGVDVGV